MLLSAPRNTNLGQKHDTPQQSCTFDLLVVTQLGQNRELHRSDVGTLLNEPSFEVTNGQCRAIVLSERVAGQHNTAKECQQGHEVMGCGDVSSAVGHAPASPNRVPYPKQIAIHCSFFTSERLSNALTA